MTLDERIGRIVDALPPGSSVTLSVDAMRAWLEEAGTRSERAATEAAEVDLTVEQAAALFNRSPSTVRGWCASRALEGAYRFQGREWRIPRAAIQAFQARQRTPKRRVLSSALSRGRPVDLGAWRRIEPKSEDAA